MLARMYVTPLHVPDMHQSCSVALDSVFVLLHVYHGVILELCPLKQCSLALTSTELNAFSSQMKMFEVKYYSIIIRP